MIVYFPNQLHLLFPPNVSFSCLARLRPPCNYHSNSLFAL
jgi:hypothetical protein